MHTLLVAINSRYSHTLLAPRYLKANARGMDVEIYETNINVDMATVVRDIVAKSPDIVGISTYVFNTLYIKALIPRLRVALPNLILIAGGFEATFDGEYLDLCDYVIKGEGDLAFGELIRDIENGAPREQIVEGGYISDLDALVSPYTDSYANLGKNRILYMETTRGCPYSCTYCMSAGKGVRAFSLDRVYDDLDRVTSGGATLVKLVDRTFNYDSNRAKAIISHVIERYADRGVCFHMEMAPIPDRGLLDVLRRAPTGLFRFEIGVQSYNADTLRAIHRTTDTERVDEFIRSLIALGNVHVHVDLIAGLPMETMASFKTGFDRLMSMRPHCLQLGFLKILPGSRMSREYDVPRSTLPPYEVERGDSMTEEELGILKGVEQTLESYYNSEKFPSTMALLMESLSPYEMLRDIWELWREQGYDRVNIPHRTKCDLLYRYALSRGVDRDRVFESINVDYRHVGNVRVWRKRV